MCASGQLYVVQMLCGFVEQLEVRDVAIGVGEQHDRRDAGGWAAALTRVGDCSSTRNCQRRGSKTCCQLLTLIRGRRVKLGILVRFR